MFGEKIDTLLLEPLTHNRNLKYELDIKSFADKASLCYEPKSEDFDKFIARSEGYFEWKGKKILDVACGRGDFIHFLSKNGALKSVGIDIQSEDIQVAKSTAIRKGMKNCEFIHGDFFTWNTNEKFDYVVSNEALDHIPNTYKALKKMKYLLKDNGSIINVCGELWKSPAADHCGGFMKLFIPWRHLIFNEKAIFNIRRKKFRPDDPGADFASIRGGLSKYTLTEYENAVSKLDLIVLKHSINFQIKSFTKYRFVNKIFFTANKIILKVPILGEYFACSLLSILKK